MIKRMRMNVVQVTLLVALGAMTMSSCSTRQTSGQKVMYVKADTVRASGAATPFEYPGKVKASEEVNLSFQVAGKLKRIYVSDGGVVRKGQLVAELDDRDYRIQLEAVEAEYNSVKADAERVIRLYNEGASTASNYDKARYGLQQITAKYENCKNQLEDTKIYSPFSGKVQKHYYQPAARGAGVSRSDVSMSMLMANGGLPVSTYYDGNRRNTIYIKCLDDNGGIMDNLENVPIMQTVPDVGGALTEENMLKMRNGTLAKGDLIESMLGTKPVKQVSDGIDIEWETPVVPRYNGQRSQKVMCSPAPGIETENARKALEAKVDQINLPEGYSVLWQGEKGASDQTMKYLFANVPIAIILIIAILILLFGDYRKPLIILCCIPLLGVGIVGAMLISGKTFTFCAIVGALGLVGMMMKNCIVLMDEINDQIASGKDPAEALISSSETRLRAVMMASMTTILGMIPLISDAMFGSMAVTIMGGLLFSTIATLFFVPLLYAVFFKIKMK